MRCTVKILYMLIGVLYFPVGTVMAWRSYHNVVQFARRCQYDLVERKLKFDGMLMMSLIAVWLVVFFLVIVPEFV